MKRLFSIIPLVLSLALILSACAPGATPAALPTVSLDAGTPGAASAGVTASAVVVPVQQARLGFTLAGRVAAVNVKVGDPVKAGDILIQLDTAALEAEAARVEGVVKSAQADFDLLVRYGEAHERRDAAEGRLDQAKASLVAAQTKLAAASLAAPFDGTIAAMDVVAGETVSPGLAIVTLADLGNFRVETTDLSERDLHAVQIGQSATVFVDALNQQLGGKVIAIAPISNTVGGDVVYKVTVQLDSQPAGLRWGMSAEVNLATE